jgi:hypothetical protein
MAQTPKSVSAYVGSTTPVTLYTVPAGATAVVKSVLTASLLNSYATVTINKVSGGNTYPIVYNAVSGYAATTGTYYNNPANATLNLLNGPITLTAGDALTISTSSTAAYKFPTNYSPTTNPNQRINNMNYLNGKYIAVGYDSSAGLGLILTSTDGITWTKQTFTYAIVITDIGFDGTNYVVCGTSNQGYTYYSTNLSSWTQVSMGTGSVDMYCITYGNSKWLMGGAGGNYCYATTPSSWTVGTLANSPAINAVLVIGTNFCFGNDYAYTYTTDFTTFITPYNSVYQLTTNANQMAIDGAGKVYVANTNAPASFPTTSLYQSTNNAKSFTAIDLTGLSPMPGNYGSVYAFGNGGKLYWSFTHPGYSNYLSSSDGVTWVGGLYSGSNYNANTNWYSTNLYTLLGTTTGTSQLFNWIYGIQRVMINGVSSAGVVGAAGVNFVYNGSSGVDPNSNGYLLPIGNVNGGAWAAIGTNPANTPYTNYWYGTSSTNGSNTQYVDNSWYNSAYGSPVAGCTRPGATGFIIGTTNGYIGYTNTNNGAINLIGRALGITQSFAAMVVNGNLATSKIVAIYTNGQSVYSTDQGQTWTAGYTFPDTFSYSTFSNGQALVYGNGVWVAWASGTYQFYYSTDGVNWIGNPYGVRNMYTLNSNNIFLLPSSLVYTAGTSPDAFVSGGAVTPSDYPSVRRMAYVGGTYFIGKANQLSQSTDLQTWTTNSFNGTQINNSLYYTYQGPGATSIAYSGSGSTFVVGNALRNASADNVSFGQPTTLANALVVGSTTVGLVEIT